MAVVVRPEPIHAEECGTDDGRCVGRVHDDAVPHLGEPVGDRGLESLVARPQQAAAEHDLDRLPLETEAGEGDARERDDFVGEPSDDRRRCRVAAASPNTTGASSISRRREIRPACISSASRRGESSPKWRGTASSRLVRTPRPSSLRAATNSASQPTS